MNENSVMQSPPASCREAMKRNRVLVRWALAFLAVLNAAAAQAESGRDPVPRNAVASADRFALLQLAAERAAPAPGAGIREAALKELVAEALKGNPEIRVARSETQAAAQRIAPAGALDDPMFEMGLLNVPTTSWRLNREEMTMKMIGLSQKLPWPGKRALRQEAAAKDAESSQHGYRETVNRVVREVKMAYFDLALANETVRLIRENRMVLEQFLGIAESRYSLAQGTQAEVLKAQTQLGRMSEELLRMEREIPTLQAELARLVGMGGRTQSVFAPLPTLEQISFSFDALQATAFQQRPQLRALQSIIERSNTAVELARKDYRPDFDVRFSYAQRETAPDGMPRTDLFNITVAINLPVWGKTKRDPRIAEAYAMRDQAQSMLEAQQNELLAKLRTQLTIAEQSRRSAKLYETAILPQSSLAVESALSAYRANRADLLMLLDSQMTLFGYRTSHAAALVNFNKALAEMEWLTGSHQAAPFTPTNWSDR
jgi:outer membrane protein TolC